ncbi:MAG TPA: NTP transferase domain-containing protein [Thermoanaerobaculia bacterium]|jgi:NDP-sugar pyrophosphorylase family protein|nr:NTP transferase domain-containing protein [Thermoanaerobaculia bacterium]
MKMVILAAGLGTRLGAVSGGRPKLLVDLGGETILDRLLSLASDLRLEPLVVTRPEHVAWFQEVRAEVLVEERPVGFLTTLYQTRDAVGDEPFVWVGGDMVFSEHGVLREIIAGHNPDDFASYVYCRTDKFKAKVRFEPELVLKITRQGQWDLSIPNFGVQSPRTFSYLAANPETDFLPAALAAGETFALREYPHPVFEIDTPLDLALARSYFERCASIS